MRKSVIAIAAIATAAVVAGSTYVYAQRGPGWGMGGFGPRMTAEDVMRNTDVRIARLHADLKLTPDQEKLWPAAEQAVKAAIKQRAELMQTHHNTAPPDNAIDRMRLRAQMMVASSETLKQIADAAEPLYKTLDDTQRRRLAALAGPGMRGRGMEGGGWHRHGWRDDRDDRRDDRRGQGWRDRDDRRGYGWRDDRDDRRDDRRDERRGYGPRMQGGPDRL